MLFSVTFFKIFLGHALVQNDRIGVGGADSDRHSNQDYHEERQKPARTTTTSVSASVAMTENGAAGFSRLAPCFHDHVDDDVDDDVDDRRELVAAPKRILPEILPVANAQPTSTARATAMSAPMTMPAMAPSLNPLPL